MCDLHQCRPCTSQDIFAKVGTGGIKKVKNQSGEIEKRSLTQVIPARTMGQ